MPDVSYSSEFNIQFIEFSIKKNLPKILNSRVLGIELLPSKISLVYKIRTSKSDYVIKVAPHWFTGSLSRELFCYEVLKGFKLAKVCGYYSEVNDYIAGYEFFILEFIDGIILDSYNFVNPVYFQQIESIYTKLHSIQLKEFGWLDNHMIGQSATWLDFVLDIDNLDSIVSSGLVSMEKINLVMDRLLEKVSCRSVKPALLYGDFNPKNFIADNSGIIIPIDFQNCFSGDYLYDYSIAVTYNEKVLDFFDARDQSLLILYATRVCLTKLAQSLFSDDKQSLKKRLALFNKYVSCL